MHLIVDSNPAPSPNVPPFDLHFVLVAPPAIADDLCAAWQSAISALLPPALRAHFTVLSGMLASLPPAALSCDCVVSPANSFGIMDGGFDIALARCLLPSNPSALTHTAQSALRARWRGYAPPASATLTSLPASLAKTNALGAHALAVVPTMRRPGDVRWHRDLVYDATWALLCEIARWNADLELDAVCSDVTRPDSDASPRRRIARVLMPGLATGTGRMSAERAARQMVLAVKHFARGAAMDEEGVDWPDVFPAVGEVERTWGL